MNTYSENLQKTVSSTLGGLYAEEQKIQSDQRSAEYNLYYAQGALISCGDHKAHTHDQLAQARAVNEQAVLCDNIVVNLADTATQQQSNTTTAISNVATAAANIKAASNSISKIAANVGSALNIALASCYNTDIYKKTQQANHFISETANEAEYTSKLAMEASSKSSELMSSDVVANVTTSKNALEALLTELNDEVAKLTTQYESDQLTENDDKKAERKAEGVLKDAKSELLGVDDSIITANTNLNLDLTCTLTPQSGSIEVASTEYLGPFYRHPANLPIIPSATNQQFVFFAKASTQSSITLEQIETLFGEYYKAPASGGSNQETPAQETPANRFYLMAPSDDQHYQSITKHYAGSNNSNLVDIDGHAIALGQQYIAYVYVELSLEYQRYIGVYDNVISSPSASFTPALNVPSVSQIQVDTNSITVTLDQPSCHDEGEVHLDCRVMLLPEDKPDESGLLNCSDYDTVPFYFNTAIAQQVSSANYIKGTVNNNSVTADITSDTTDNFGDPLDKSGETTYYVAVLCLPADAADQTSYIPHLTLDGTTYPSGTQHTVSPPVSSASAKSSSTKSSSAKKTASKKASGDNESAETDQE
ncbi:MULTISPECIES: hypothetical protein [Pseudoalteromonas]|uniref:Uncharacterized protein n=1 Tax=Pseudoalteromonas amylolytica TaxID=1859457 RepID=A0A1S1MTZ1_9GAMM|nr:MULTISPECIES: hypothetical protein [Pseudoalteromonas]OHU84955.1 hypothetical protein BFC16_19900 [Pseudoalteromonas sp. JW3]OHU90094.1 hypothetical protein BET10_15075 [Pseudoalteromonas amylolytica]